MDLAMTLPALHVQTDAKLSLQQCTTIISAAVILLEKLQAAETQRRALLEPLTQVLATHTVQYER